MTLPVRSRVGEATGTCYRFTVAQAGASGDAARESFQLPLRFKEPVVWGRHAFTLPAALTNHRNHQLAVSLVVREGEVEFASECPAHGSHSERVSVLTCVCVGRPSATVCGECEHRASALLRIAVRRCAKRDSHTTFRELRDFSPDREGWTPPVLGALRQARALVDPARARLVSAVHPCAREPLYELLADDRLGRRGQLVAGRPVLLAVLAHLAFPAHRSSAVQPILGLIDDGARLAHIENAIGEIAQFDAACTRRLAWLARRLPPWSEPGAVLTVAARDVPPSDLPADPDAATLWLSTLENVMLHVRGEEVDAALWDSVARQASRQYSSMAGLDDSDVRRYADYLHFGSALPPRSHDATQLMSWVERGMEELETEDLLADLDLRPDEELSAPLEGVQQPGLHIEPIATGARLLHETRSMRHCIVTYATALRTGRFAAYHVEHEGEPSTVLLEQKEGWQVREHSGVANRPVTAEARAAVKAWVVEANRVAAAASSKVPT